MTQEELERAIKEIWTLFKETDKRIEKLSKETDKKIKELTKNVNALTGKWGRFVEGLVAPAPINMFKERGIEVETIHQRVNSHKDGKEIEIDILATNREYAILIEVKSTLGVDDVKEHIERLKVFKKFFPEYADRKVIGAVAGIVIEENADKFAYKNGLFVIGQKGDTAKILNDKKFKPKVW